MRTAHVLTLSALPLILGCGGGSSPAPQAQSAPPPSIGAFLAATPSFSPLDGTTLTATFSNGSAVVNPGGLQISSGKPLSVHPSMTTRFELVVTGSDGQVARQSLMVRPQQLSAGGYGTSFLVDPATGLLWASGYGTRGRLGNGQFANTAYFNTVAPFGASGTHVQALSAGFHALALRSDHTVWTWGPNGNGNLGDGTTTDRESPVQVMGITDGVDAVAGLEHCVALRSDGTVWTWGLNDHGQLGDTTATFRPSPSQVGGLSDVAAVYATGYASLALKADGTLWAWGENSSGELGDGTTSGRHTPAPVPGMTGVASVTTGAYYALALKTDGTLWAWGMSENGQLGIPAPAKLALSPVQVKGLDGLVAVAGGASSTLGLKADGSVWAWGDNSFGALGDGTTTSSPTPIQVKGLPKIAALARTGYQSLALGQDGQHYGWGHNRDGQLGLGNRAHRRQALALNWGGNVAAGNQWAMALTQDGQRFGWGSNQSGQLAFGTSGTSEGAPSTASAMSVPGLLQLSAGNAHCVAVARDGRAWAWGDNAVGQSGPGALPGVPNLVAGSNGVTLTNVVSVAAGHSFGAALTSNGEVWVWGRNNFGQAGDGSKGATMALHKVPGLQAVCAIAAGFDHLLALDSDGHVHGWGINLHGETGNGSIAEQTTPGLVVGPDANPLLEDVVDIAAGGYKSLALKADGTLWAWGNNIRGELGTGDFGSSVRPVQVQGLQGVSRVWGNGWNSAAQTQDGGIWMWGNNSSGQLGDGSSSDRPAPFRLPFSQPIRQFGLGIANTYAVTPDGHMWSWGNTQALGDFTLQTANRLTPGDTGFRLW